MKSLLRRVRLLANWRMSPLKLESWLLTEIPSPFWIRTYDESMRLLLPLSVKFCSPLANSPIFSSSRVKLKLLTVSRSTANSPVFSSSRVKLKLFPSSMFEVVSPLLRARFLVLTAIIASLLLLDVQASGGMAGLRGAEAETSSRLPLRLIIVFASTNRAGVAGVISEFCSVVGA